MTRRRNTDAAVDMTKNLRRYSSGKEPWQTTKIRKSLYEAIFTHVGKVRVRGTIRKYHSISDFIQTASLRLLEEDSKTANSGVWK